MGFKVLQGMESRSYNELVPLTVLLKQHWLKGCKALGQKHVMEPWLEWILFVWFFHHGKTLLNHFLAVPEILRTRPTYLPIMIGRSMETTEADVWSEENGRGKSDVTGIRSLSSYSNINWSRGYWGGGYMEHSHSVSHSLGTRGYEFQRYFIFQ